MKARRRSIGSALELMGALACLLFQGCARADDAKPIEELVDEIVSGSEVMARTFENKPGPGSSVGKIDKWFSSVVEVNYPNAFMRARSQLLERDREAIHAVVKRLESVDLGKTAGTFVGEFLTQWLTEALCGGFGWSLDRPAQTAVVRDWVELAQRVEADEGFWRLSRAERAKFCAGIAEGFVPAETVLLPRAHLRAETREGPIEVTADPGFGRSYTWAGATRFAVLTPRLKRWYGSQGIYCPGSGDHWKEHDGLTRGVLDEGQLHFDSEAAALQWLVERKGMNYVYRADGLVVGWARTPERQQLNVDVWQLYVKGTKPRSLPGSNDDAITVE